MAPIRGVIFDVDGTLVDSNDGHAKAWVEALAEFGYDVPYDGIRPLIGMGGDKVLPMVAGLGADETKGKRIAARREAIFAERYLPHVRPLPGARELIVRLRRDGFRLAVASSSKKDMLERLLALLGGEEMFDATTSSDDADHSKPDPDIVEVAVQRVGEPPERLVMAGDTPYDIEAATRTGVRSIGFRSGGWSDADLRGAIAIYDGPADLLAHLEESVLAPAAVRP